jgi:hypothetical protein
MITAGATSTTTMNRAFVTDALGAGQGVLRLEPCWVPRTFMVPGRRLRLHPDDLYALGGHRGGINERWFSSTTNADNGPGTPPDEGLSYVRGNGSRFQLKIAVDVAGDLLLGSPMIERDGGWTLLCKFFDNLGPIPHHMHQSDAQAELVGRKGKPEAYYFPPQYNQLENNFPYMPFTEPSPLNFNDHDGYVPIFDGRTLDGWDGNPTFWRVEDGAIVGESTPERPSGNSYIAYRRMAAKDFTLKFEIKVEGNGGSGLQYRSRTGLPWLANIPANVTAFNGPVNLNWMMTGPQADFWPSRIYTGQFYSENTPMRILAWRGQVVEGFGERSKRLMGTIGDREALGAVVKQNDWNQYTVIARGGTFLHIINGQLMAVMIDDDPMSSNNQSGFFGIEIEATTKLSVRNIWLKKLI